MSTSTPSTAAASPSSAPAPNDPVAHTTAFFDALYEEAPSELCSLLWTLQDKRSVWTPLMAGPGRVAERARELADAGNDVYVAVSLSTDPGGRDTRIKSANAAGIFGLWADIDIADPDVHKKWNLPPSEKAAMSLLEATEVPPTMVVHSGHGLQAWWLFKEFWRFENEDDRLNAAGLAQRWNTTLQSHAASKKWVVDSTYDLARVMRVPGTLNRKGDPVMPVRLIVADGPRYDPQEIEPFCRDESYLPDRIDVSRSYKPDKVELSETGRPDIDRFQALMDNDSTFELTFRMKRKDLPDQSPSSYDMSLAIQAARVAWSDQEIAKLIYYFRKTNKLDTAKALRPDYIDRTLSRARDFVARENISEELDDAEDALVAAQESGDDERIKAARRAARDVISDHLGLEVLHFIKYLSEPPVFALVTPTKTVPLGGADGILVWAKFRQSVWQTLGHQIERCKPAEWDKITRLIPRAWEEQDVGAEATERGELASWLSAYLAQRPPVDTVQEAIGSEYPYIGEDGRVVLFGSAFRRFLYLTYQERITNKDLGRRLRDFDCKPDKVAVEHNGKRTSRGIWKLPEMWSTT